MKNCIALFLTLAIVFAFVPVMPVFSNEVLDKPDMSITIVDKNGNTKTYEPGMEYHEGDILEVVLTWILDMDNYRFDGDSFEYILGDMKVDPNNSYGILYDNKDPVGTYEVDNNNILHVYLYPEFVEDHNRDVVIILKGTLSADPTHDDDGQNHSFKIGEEEITVVMVYDDSKISLAKHVTGPGHISLDENGKYMIEFEIEVMPDGNVSNIVINDILDPGLYFPDNITNWFIFDFNYNNDHDDINHNENVRVNRDMYENISFEFDGEFHRGDIITISYKVYVDEEIMNNLVVNSDEIGNIASGTYTDNHGHENQPIPDACAKANVYMPKLSKNGIWVDDNIIDWTITLQTGSMGDLDNLINNKNKIWSKLNIKNQNDLLNYLGFSTIKDSLGSGLIYDGNLDLDNLTFDDFEKISGPDSNGSYVYVLTIRTIADGSQLVYNNDISSSFFGKQINDSASVGKESNIYKESNGVNTDGTMSWTITFELPDNVELLTSFSIKEIASIPYLDNINKHQDGFDYADYWTHQVILESILINDMMPDDLGVTIKTQNDNILINFDVNHSFFLENTGKTITITLKTEIIDEYNHRVTNAFDSKYYYTNIAQYIIDNSIVGSSNANVTNINEDDVSIIVKNPAENLNTNNISDTWWYIEITDDFVFNRGNNLQGILASDNPFDLILIDKLPENMDYVEGSAFVEFYMGSDLQEFEIPANIDDLNIFLTSIISVKDNENGIITLHWNMTEEFRQQILNFKLYDAYQHSTKPLADGLFIYETPDDEDGYTVMWPHVKLRFYYATTLSPSLTPSDFGEDGKTFINTVEGTVNGNNIGTDNASVIIKKSNALSKSYDYDKNNRKSWADRSDFTEYYGKYSVGSNGIYNIYYQVDINPQRLMFGNGGTNQIILVDTMDSGISLVPGSIRVIDLDNNNSVLDQSQYDVVMNFEENSFKITLPDSTHFMLEYFASINEITQNGTIMNATNKIELFGNWFEQSEVTNWPNTALSPDGYARSSDNFDIHKYYKDANGDVRLLTGAKFRLTAYMFDSTINELVMITSEQNENDFPNVLWEQISNPTINFTNLHRNYVYCLEEIEAPKGFKLSDKCIWFIFSDYHATNVGEVDQIEKEQILNLFPYLKEFENGESIYFENEFKEEDVTNEMFDLNVSKIIMGSMGNLNEKFEFTLTLLSNEFYDLPIFIEYIKGDKRDTIELIDDSCEFTLSHNESITFLNLPAYTEYILTESNNEYDTSIIVSDNTITGKTYNGILEENISIVYTNTKDAIIPTGISLSFTWILPFVVLLCIPMLFVIKRHKIKNSK